MADPSRQQKSSCNTIVRCYCWLGWLCLFSLIPLTTAAETIKPAELFNTVEFRGSLKALPKWTKVVAAAQQQVKDFTSCTVADKDCSAAARSWQQMEAKAHTLAPMAQLKWVNRFFNRWPYRLDLETYGLRDYWATPQEFMQFSGDCEDYSISKYFALRRLGYPAARLRIVVLKDAIRNLAHAVLAVYSDGEIYLLDNLSDLVLSHNRYQHYLPQYSVNEEYRWAHIQKMKQLANTQTLTKGP